MACRSPSWRAASRLLRPCWSCWSSPAVSRSPAGRCPTSAGSSPSSSASPLPVSPASPPGASPVRWASSTTAPPRGSTAAPAARRPATRRTRDARSASWPPASSSTGCCTRSSRCRSGSGCPTRWPSASARTAENASAGMYELLSGLVAAEEATRGQLSAELHDTAAQSLMLARSLLADVLDQLPDVPAQLERVSDYVGEAEDQVRAVMARTRPPALRDGDLARAVGHLRDDMAQPVRADGLAQLAARAVPAVAGQRDHGLPVLPGGPAQRGQARRRRRGVGDPRDERAGAHGDRRRRRPRASTRRWSSRTRAATSVLGCCASGPGSPVARSPSPRCPASRPRCACGCRATRRRPARSAAGCTPAAAEPART